MKSTRLRFLSILAVATLGLATSAFAGDMAQSDHAMAMMPMKQLGVGDHVPAVTVLDEASRPHDLAALVREKPTVLIFYRGGWCPYCNMHLAALVGIEDELRAAGYQLLAVSADQPMKLRETPDRGKIHYQLFSDQEMKAADALGISFEVKPDDVRMFKEKYQIDLEAASGRTHHKLPHPAVYVVDTSGTIRFAHVNPDYKHRLEPQKIVAAAKDAAMMTTAKM
ncbi:peroxiredoxin-like family protein [Opitutus terrae]|uniref:thioredoxin-dependent peroxiredoxin n=1 Tax=Opitutus terrae (strain DSM 11246 / JCM 15787 / PB90-1) TaxID=452637 RepID=B1ZMN8_OPITP|nr:peroxiredoxin-like family protein [Opitutus terrae]ACB74386.1 alkyl hydroperoxide reductase/ Thiol specific antioxidant/ Mal allergen [Opitutus terrae PB90-1]